MNYQEAGIPARWHQAAWADFDGSGLARTKAWADSYPESWLPPTAHRLNTGMGLLLTGDAGTGKTTAAALAIKDVVDHGHEAWFVTAPSLEGMLYRQMDLSTLIRKADEVDDATVDKFEAITSRLDRARMRYTVLAIDDWGRERNSGSAFLQDYIESLVRERFNRGLPTILTTNLNFTEIEARFGRPWVSFTREAFDPIDFGTRDHRAGR